MLLDDNKDLLMIAQIILKGAGYTVMQACCVEEAEQKIKACKPSLLLLDVFIKEEDGREFCSRLKKDAATRQIKIIMMSGIETENESLKIIGADDFIQKPFNYDELLNKVEQQMLQVQA